MTTVEQLLEANGVAVITGGASGFGLEAAKRCAAAHMAVAILDTNEASMSTAAEAVASAGATAVLTIRCDVSSWDACVAAADRIEAHFDRQRVTFLFNNAGIASGGAEYSGTVLNGTQNDTGWRKVMDVNLFGAVNILRVFIPRFVAAGPLPSGRPVRVVTTSSVMGCVCVSQFSLSHSLPHIIMQRLRGTVCTTGQWACPRTTRARWLALLCARWSTTSSSRQAR